MRARSERSRHGRQTAADDEVVRTVKLEQKQLARLKRAKLRSATWVPEIDLADGPGGQKLEPVEVGYANIYF
jgi:hypothetical protein